jgi:hypothetical protein
MKANTQIKLGGDLQVIWDWHLRNNLLEWLAEVN